jgi:hypothetical protein
MLDEEQKQRIKLYSPAKRSRLKSQQRRFDNAEVRGGNAEELQARNRALPPAWEFEFADQEEALPTE